MIDFVDIQFAQTLSGRMERFKVTRTNPYRINFRCPLCGDSQKSRTKARGWLLEKDNNFVYYCHNCGASHSFSYFLKLVDPMAFKDYVSEKFMNKHKKPEEKSTLEKTTFEAPKFDNKAAIKSIKKVSQLDHHHYAKIYINERLIPSAQHYRMYFTPKFKTWVNSIYPGKFESVEKDEPRLVVPFFDKDKKMFGVSGRSFKPDSNLRYITIMFEDQPKIFGLDTVNFANPYYVVEGQFDSMFLKNAVAMAGAEGNTTALQEVAENAVFVFDAEPRNKEICNRMEKIIDKGYKIVIWPSDVPGKDINEMVLNGHKDIEGTLRNNVYRGLEAKMKFTYWKKS
jgi:transcription elongation factor Elf1